ncbi:phosphonate metabolism protein PhnF [Rhodococcus sp. SC4]|uniref:GntR family transcriptional regulator n=1 Tax=Rhodococcus sp. LB1 TaxID=1807499 RepID=UPI00076A502F|nr:GntR family transcriptional regulator [Rhodococcus sp. LB1]KXF56060.1 phosphonate metabolism protein PhnF [Rhodococcus sp. SC4]KXX55710.1 phosphonate metabolism protein PhnF [Rhodococcus sp. LB1]
MTEHRYRTIADQLECEIESLAPGTKLDSEHELMKRFGVGRAAARGAVQELERRLRVRRVQGAGTFVAERIDYVISRDRRPSWHRTVREAGAVPRSVILERTLAPLPADCADRLEVPHGTPAHHMVRLSYINDVVAGLGFEWISHDAVPDLAEGMRVEESLDEVLRQMGHVRSVRSWCRTASDIPPADVQEKLQLVSAVPVWVVESVNRDADTGTPLTYSKAWMRGDAVRVVMEIGSPDEPRPLTTDIENDTKEVSAP